MHPPSFTKELQGQVDQYGSAHRHPINRALHYVGIPVLMVSAVGLLGKLSFVDGAGPVALRPNAGWLALAVVAAWYLWADWKTGAVVWPAFASAYAVGSVIPGHFLGVLFGAGATAHVIGHTIEGKPPSVFSNPFSLVVAPAWLLSRLATASR